MAITYNDVLRAKDSAYNHPNFSDDSDYYRFQRFLIYEILDEYLPERLRKADFFRPQNEKTIRNTYIIPPSTELYLKYLNSLDEECMASQIYVNAVLDFKDDEDFMNHVNLRVEGREDGFMSPMIRGFYTRRDILQSLDKKRRRRMDVFNGMSREYLDELIESLDCSDDVKNDVWSIIMEVKLYELSAEVTDLEKDFMRKRNQLNLLEKYFDGLDVDE